MVAAVALATTGSHWLRAETEAGTHSESDREGPGGEAETQVGRDIGRQAGMWRGSGQRWSDPPRMPR